MRDFGRCRRVDARTQLGMALVLGLLLLAALSLLAVMAARGMLLQQRMAANFEDRQQALANADLAAAAARAWLYSRSDVDREAGCMQDCLLPPAVHHSGELPTDPEYRGGSWWRLNAQATGQNPVTGDPVGAGPTAPASARWLMEELHFEPFGQEIEGPVVGAIGYYRLFARGEGTQTGSIAVVESIVARPWEGAYRPADYPPEPGSERFCRQFDPVVPCGTLAWRQRR